MVHQWHGLLWDHTQWRVDCERCVVHLGTSERRAAGQDARRCTPLARTSPARRRAHRQTDRQFGRKTQSES
eukprot:scaffold8306_cov45-Phaeocystis_antarctica.AAC.2